MVESSDWDATAKTYTLNITKQGRQMQITARHVVMATGAGSQSPVMPNISDKVSRKQLFEASRRSK